MPAVEIRPDIHWVGVNDHTTDLFEGLWPISREGVSYNAYFINAGKKAIIDLAKSIKVDEFLDRLRELSDPQAIDYIVLNHMEPDHTGILKVLRDIAPSSTILCSAKAKPMIEGFFGITDNVEIVEDGQTIDLGGKTLTFHMTPFVHWPETMMTYEENEKILFSCDGFGGYGALRGAIFDDEYADFGFYRQESLRYYANIVASFSAHVLRAIDRLADIPVEVIAPSHGLIWRENPSLIVDLYRKWAEYADNGGEQAVTLIYGSMYGNTETLMDAVFQGLSHSGVNVEAFDIARTHASYILPALWSNRGVLLGVPTYENRLFPPAAHLLDLAERKNMNNKLCGYFGSYGWAGGAVRELEKRIGPLRWELVESFAFRGGATREKCTQGKDFGLRFGRMILEST